jgi:hypothetical protein
VMYPSSPHYTCSQLAVASFFVVTVLVSSQLPAVKHRKCWFKFLYTADIWSGNDCLIITFYSFKRNWVCFLRYILTWGTSGIPALFNAGIMKF